MIIRGVPSGSDDVDAMDLDPIEVDRLAGPVNGSREVDASGDEKYNGDGRGIDNQKLWMLQDALEHADLHGSCFTLRHSLYGCECLAKCSSGCGAICAEVEEFSTSSRCGRCERSHPARIP